MWHILYNGILLTIKRNELRYTQLGSLLKALWWVKETRPKRLHTVWFKWYSQKEKARKCQRTDQWLAGVKGI